MKRLSFFLVAVTVLGAARTDAQTLLSEDKIFISVNGGYQSGTQSFDDRQSFSLYGENGRFDTGYRVDRRGGLFDLSGGVRVWRRLAVGAGFSWTSSDQGADLTASVPHPLFFSRPRTAVSRIGNLNHTETAVHIQARWTVPVSRRIAVALVLGPSIFNVRQDVVTSVATQEVGAPFDQTQIASVSSTTQRKTAAGGHVGLDISMMATRQLGGGLFVRYAAASPKVDLASKTVALKAGGFQSGLGVRVQF
ncbi:MAG: hypothetical protein HY701_04675 [Gemmatimonadetes bacterium]|nr:hypothetical protein [Gemmatimonadota bacterium]